MNPIRSLVPLPALLLLASMLIAGCGGGSDQGAAPSGGPHPKRIISLSPSATEMLYAIGAGPQVKAVDELSNHPKNAPRTKLSGFKPNAEAIIDENPDLVVLSDDMNGIVKSLTKVKIPVVQTPAATKLADSYAEITRLGKATGHSAQAAKVVAGMKKGIAAAVAKVKKPATPLTYYHELDPSFHSATSKTFIGQVYGLFGLKNIADKAKEQAGGYPKLSAEYVAEADPDLVFLADTKCCGQTAAKLGERPGWAKLTAVRNDGVVPLDDDIASRWGPRIVDLAQQVGAAVTKAEQAQ